MDFSLSAEQEAMRDAVGRICARFGDDYWLAKDADGGFPVDFHRAFALAVTERDLGAEAFLQLGFQAGGVHVARCGGLPTG